MFGAASLVPTFHLHEPSDRTWKEREATCFGCYVRTWDGSNTSLEASLLSGGHLRMLLLWMRTLVMRFLPVCSKPQLHPGRIHCAVVTSPPVMVTCVSFGGQQCPALDEEGCARMIAEHVKITTGELLNPKASSRQSIPAVIWRWQTVFATKWKFLHHINSLEMRALLLALKWRARFKPQFNCRIVHLVDSFVALSICSKGRTSSKLLTKLAKQISAYTLAMSYSLVLAHVDSHDNPSDKGSRLV